MGVSRRTFLKGAAAAAGAAAIGIPEITHAVADPDPAAAAGTTLDHTYRIASRVGRPGGYAPILVGPGEPTVVRTDLGGVAQTGREGRRQVLSAFAQLSDVHVVDSESPARVEWLDRLNDGPINEPLNASYRPQETLTAHVADAMIRQINSIGAGPMTGEPLGFAVQTGDNADNTQLNEVRWNIDLLDGGTILPRSGSTGYESVMDNNPLYYDAHYWHPDGTPLLRTDDFPRARYGFPVIPNLLLASAQPFISQGLNMPWYTAHGNHDGLVQGNFPVSAAFDTLARGGLKLISSPPGISPDDVLKALSTDPQTFLGALVLTPYVRIVRADKQRRTLKRKETIAQHFVTTGRPVGHGFTQDNVVNDNAYYTFDRGNIRFIVLDTVNPNGYADGSLNRSQFTWLLGQLQSSALGSKYVVICSHHTSETMGNPLIGTGLGSTDDSLEQRVLGPAVVTALQAQPRVIAWVNGHSHHNRVTPRSRPGGGGFWEINTASHVDWPQQARLIEITDNRDGTLSIFTTMVDHAGPASYGGVLTNQVALASVSRELAANDWQGRAVNDQVNGVSDRNGAPTDRNVELILPEPA